MKLLFLVESYYPKTSGVPVVVKYLAEGLASKGHEVAVATTSVEGRADTETFNGVRIFRFAIRKTLLKRYVGDIDNYRKFVVSFHADANVFECSECVTTDVLLPVLNQIHGKKIFHSHGFYGMKMKPFKWNVNLKYSLGNTYNWVRFKWYYGHSFKEKVKMFDAAICLSEIDSSKEWLERNAKKVTVLQNAVDEVFLQKTKGLDIEPFVHIDKPYVVSVATYCKVKNQIGILREFYKTESNCALVFVGPEETEYYGFLQDELKKIEARSSIRKEVHILKGIPRNLIPDVIGNAALYLVGSLTEEYSISLIEAMTKGIPFISTNVGNARILPGGVTINKMSEMHEQIDELLQDKAKYRKLSETGKLFVSENCIRSKAVDLLEKIIVEL